MHTDITTQSRPTWQQVSIYFDNYPAAESTVVAHLRPVLIRAESMGLIASWFFIRKAPTWRLRFLPGHDGTAEATRFIQRHLENLHRASHIARWMEVIYEPEVHAFGGPAAMDIAHEFFHYDSRHILAYLAGDRPDRSATRDQRRELSMLLCSLFLRCAEQDWYEQGDIWTRVAENRPLPADTPSERLHGMEPDLRKLLTVDAGPDSTLVNHDGPLASLADWSSVFANTGARIDKQARNGTLTRGVRAVLAHQILFHWNRLGLPYRTQSTLAHVAKTVILHQ